MSVQQGCVSDPLPPRVRPLAVVPGGSPPLQGGETFVPLAKVAGGHLRALAAGTLSGLLLVLSLPKPDLYPLAWIALIPWLYVIGSGITLRQTFLASYAGGLVFFAGTFYWIAE